MANNNQTGLLKAALVIGGTAVAAFLSKKENRDKVLEEYNKAKQDPKGYADNAKGKAANLQQVAKEEINKAKEDPNAYKANLTSKVEEKVAPLKEKAAPLADKLTKKDVTVEEEKQNFDDEGGANNIHVVTDKEVAEKNPNAVSKDELK
ncbi:YtxH domain-containing protein [Macrococcus epidermidis]|uniref:YtxH domain-containing protein n=2 Tax=Staphylococcaceae TaxID=90964 RepID=A0A2G5NNW8_9STAP|nr:MULTISPECIES: YtxH domain-containing protein [Macrococcus]MCG7419777.1 YtxH domain-containing protein [Macrococcus epidermidis]MCH4983901.1 YtxH domain-containing protein [Macrococcus sp. PK]RAI82171.1 YtxH domain-containing protein [Macrococcus goetzii]RAK44434.1 YtxH domain-containing protein [Macrococcus epidermidis]TDM46196.1 YtxH domain-containing protein [Macrococcus goetzii]